MAFVDYEVSVESGQPVELYALALGTTTWRFHNSLYGETISYGGNDYTPLTVSRGSIGGAQESVSVTIPADHTYSLNFVEIAPGQLSTLTIYEFHRAEPASVQVKYKGIVRSISFGTEGFGTTLTVIPLTATFDKTIPDRTYQAQCNHVLFDSRCQVSASSFKHTDTASAAVLNVLTVNNLSSKGSGWATGGYVAYGVLDFRLILNHTGNNCTLVLPFYQDVLGNSVDVYAGCAHDIGICNTKFSNEINFGGCPHVPTKEIFRTGL
jgi:uncharacterized phage protein (TIGR02218 family)